MTKIHPNEDFFTNLTTRAVLRRHFQLQNAANKKETYNTTDTGTLKSDTHIWDQSA